MKIPRKEDKFQKKFFVFKIYFEQGMENSHKPEQDTRHRQSRC